MAVWIVRIVDGVEPLTGSSLRFADVPADAWWAPYVERLANLNIAEGCDTDPARFCPTEPVRRDQMASFLVRSFDLPGGDPGMFSDIEGNVHEANIDAVDAAGVTLGCAVDPSRYCPDAKTSRAQMATVLYRALQFKLHDPQRRVSLRPQPVTGFRVDCARTEPSLAGVTTPTARPVPRKGNSPK